MPEWGFHSGGTVASVLLISELVLRIVLCVRVIMRREGVAETLAWVVVLLLVPVVSETIYFFIGERGLGGHRAERLDRAATQTERRAMSLWRNRQDEWSTTDADYERLSRLLLAAGGMPPLRGNSLELLDHATEVLTRLAGDIDRAERHVHLEYYIWMPAAGGVTVADAVIRAARRGVDCRVLVDGVGSRGFLKSPLHDRMREAGVRIAPSLPVSPPRVLLARVDLRNHRKIAVIDGKVAYCGSQNLTDETFRSTRRKRVGPWIDVTVRIRGPLVLALQTVFLQDWLADSEEEITDFAPLLPEAAEAGGTVVQLVASGPGPRPEAIHQVVLGLVFGAREEIIMTTPYFVPDEATKAALINAAMRGVAVTLVLPDVLDARLTAAASRAYYEELLEAGVTIMHHLDGLLHAKTFTVDRRTAVITSANFDRRSFWLNFETSLFMYDHEFAGSVRYLQMKYLAESVEVTLEDCRNRAWLARFGDQCAQLLSPLL